MASGTIKGEGWGVQARIEWSSTKGTNGSTVKATLYAQNASGFYWNATVNQGYSLTINGSKVSGSTARLSSTADGKATLISHSVSVSYTGSKSITISGTMNCSNIYSNSRGEYIGTRSVEGTAKLDTVGSKPTIPTVSSPTTAFVSEKGTTTTIKWSKSTSYNNSGGYYVELSKDGGSYSKIKTITSLSTTELTYTIPAGTNKTYRFRVCAYNDIGSSSYSYSGTLTTNSISAPTIGTISTYNPYVTSTLSIPLSGGSQANGSSFKRMAALYYGSTKLATCTAPSNGNTTASITYSASNFASKLGKTKYSDKFTIKAWSENSNGTKSSTVSKDFTVNLNSDGKAVPSLSNPTLSGGALSHPSTCFIVGVTDLVVTSATATAQRATDDVTISYKIECTGMSAKSSKSATFSGLSAGVKTIRVTATDSRGLSTTKTVYCRFQSYAKPTLTITGGERLDNPNTSAKVTYTVKYSNIYSYTGGYDTPTTPINNISVQEYSLNGAEYKPYTSGGTITGLSVGSAHEIKIRVADKVQPTVYRINGVTIPTIESLLSIRKERIGINCIPESGYALDVNGNVRIMGELKYQIADRTIQPVTMLEGDSTGDGVIIGAKGLTIIGSGESTTEFLNNAGLSGSTEHMYITGDSSVRIITKLGDGYSGRQTFTFGSDGSLAIPDVFKFGSTTLYTNANNRAEFSGSLIVNRSIFAHTTINSEVVEIPICGLSSSDNIYIGSAEESKSVGDTNIYASVGAIKINSLDNIHIGSSDKYTKNIHFGTKTSKATALKKYWADDSVHDFITLTSDGLTSSFGWSGSSTYSTVTNLRGQTVQCKGSTTWTSDENLKYDIEEFSDKIDVFYRNLKPCSYKYILGSSGRSHSGYVTQEVEKALAQAGLTTKDFAGVVISPITRETETNEYGECVDIERSESNYLLDKGITEQHNLAYTEFIALNTHMIQKLLNKVDELENEIKSLKCIE